MSFFRRIASVGIAAAVTCALTVGLSGSALADTPPPAPPTASPTAEPPRSDTQSRIEAYMKEVPGGEQVSDNAVSFKDGTVIVVFPDPGEARAPDGLGRNVRENAPPLGAVITAAHRAPAQPITALDTGYIEGCPYSTESSQDWYCFYEHDFWGGRRLQFKDTCYDSMSNWGFNNQTTSWVNTNPYKTIYAWNYSDYTGALWTEPGGVSKSSNVGTSDNDKLTTWTASGSPGACP